MTLGNAATPSPPPPDQGHAYTKQFRLAAQLRFLAFFFVFFAYVLLGINQWSVSLAQSATNNFYLQLLISWSALWLLCAVAQLPPALYSFYLDRKFQIAKSGLRPWFRDFLKSTALVFAFGTAIVGIAFASNALVTGIGSARRILLTDTLISALSEDEVDAIVAHELGHCALHHIRARLLLQSLIFVGIFYVLNLAVRHQFVIFSDGNLGWNDLTLVPGFFIYWSCVYLYGKVLLGMLSRKQETAADLYSWTLIGRSGPFISAMRKLTELNLIVFDKKSEWKFMHPATVDRIVAAEQFARAHGETITLAEVSSETTTVSA
jgi:Zn-dependent protease with chaperone function